MESREDIEQAAATWIARRDSGAWTDADATSLAAWLAESVGHRVAYYRLNSAWTEAGRARVLGTVAPASPSAPVDIPAAPERRTRRRLAIVAVAASIVVLAAGMLATFRDELFHTHRFTTVIGGLQTIPMSDGSRVTLNTDSDIRILLSDRERVVDIDRGEAFFQVAHDPNRPFVVKAGKRRVIAVGTQFSVRREDAGLRVIVSEGTVRYEGPGFDGPGFDTRASGDAASANVVLLPAGSIARVEGDAVRVQQRPVTEAERNLTWRNGFLTFRDTALADAVAEFNRYNSRKILIEDPGIATLTVGGVFRSNNVDSFVHLLERAFGIRADVRPDRVVLTAQRQGFTGHDSQTGDQG